MFRSDATIDTALEMKYMNGRRMMKRAGEGKRTRKSRSRTYFDPTPNLILPLKASLITKSVISEAVLKRVKLINYCPYSLQSH